MLPAVLRSRVERRLRAVGKDLQRLRAELAVAEEQLGQLVDEADDARLRSVVSETALADQEHREAQRHAAAMSRHRDRVLQSIAELEALQDELLDQL
jgi:hypothetical protein